MAQQNFIRLIKKMLLKFKKIILKYLIKDSQIWEMSGDIAERFCDKYSDDSMKETTGQYDDLREKFYYWIKCGLLNK